MSAERSSVFFYLGLGCITVMVLCAVCVAGAGFMTYRWGQRVSEELKDPVRRDEAARRVLGADELPEGFHPVVAIELPFSVMKVVVLSDVPSGPEGEPGGIGQRGFIYVDMMLSAGDEDELRAYFEGETDDPDVLRRNNINVGSEDIVARGVIESGEADLLYLVQRGEVSAQDFGGRGLSAVTLVDCPEDKRLRLGIWIEPDPDPDAPFDRLDVRGTPADESTLAEFMGRFSLCP